MIFKDMEAVKRKVQNDLHMEVLAYLMVNRNATYATIAHDAMAVLGLEKESSVRSALTSLAKKGYIKRTKNDMGESIYMPIVVVEDQSGLELFSLVDYYLFSTGEHGRSMKPTTPDEIVKELPRTEAVLLAIIEHYDDDVEIAHIMAEALETLRRTVRPDLAAPRKRR
ncbi:hypothetical protein EF808_00045 [archaeon]|nr:MAG: hypothetical protein EF808_00045 [archaeon]